MARKRVAGGASPARGGNVGHDALVRQLRALARRADRTSIAGAFVVSLGEPPGFWRAPLIAWP